MFEIREKPKMVERAFLAGIYFKKHDHSEAENLLEELEALTGTLGVPVVGRMLARVPQPHPKLLAGTGKAQEIIEAAKAVDADVLIFDNELTPGQQRNWEKLSGITVIDRHEVIIDIFAQRAQTKEAALQVDLARLEYSLPRLTRAWGHLGRQAGGIGGRGEGEMQLEVDRRLVRKQIDKLKAELETVRSQRATQRKQRERLPLPNAAIVGYTNAGKSSLLKRLTKADVLVEDKLFATLDTTTRKIVLPSNQTLLLTDTVGFIRKLPHQLVEAFKATLEEAVIADFLIHVVDASHPQVHEFHATTLDVLAELGADTKTVLTVLNKMDRVEDQGQRQVLLRNFPDAVMISVRTGQGLGELFAHLDEMMATRVRRVEILVPHERSDVVSLLHRQGKVLHSDYINEGIRLSASVPPKLMGTLQPFVVG
jgi:GTP-binding protein HflX